MSNNEQKGSHSAKIPVAIQTTVPGSFPPFFKGQLAWLNRQGLEVHTVSAPGAELKWVVDVEKVTTHDIPMTRNFSPWKDLIAIGRLRKLYREFGFKLVHAFTPKGGFLAMIAATLAGTPVRLFTIWGLAQEVGSFRVRLMLLADKVSCALAHKVFVECPSIGELAVAKGLCPRHKIIVLPGWSTNSLDHELTDLSKLEATRAVVRQEWKLPQNALVFGFVGRVVRDKGISELVEAFESLSQDFPDLHLMIIGVRENEDSVNSDVLRRIELHPRIRCTGFQWDMARMFSALDFLVHPSYREGLPTAPLEAAARGLPVIATRIPGCIDAVKEGETGLLVPPRDSKKLAEAIRTYVENPALRNAHGKSGRAWVLKEYDRQKAWDQLLDVYKKLLKAHGEAKN